MLLLLPARCGCLCFLSPRFLIQGRLHLMDTDCQGFMEFNMNNEILTIHILLRSQIPTGLDFSWHSNPAAAGLKGLGLCFSSFPIVFFCSLFNYIDFSQHNNKLTTIIFIVYSYMFRLTWVIFRLELYLFSVSLCSFWNPRCLHVFCIDVIYFTVIEGCNKCHCFFCAEDLASFQ